MSGHYMYVLVMENNEKMPLLCFHVCAKSGSIPFFRYNSIKIKKMEIYNK